MCDLILNDFIAFVVSGTIVHIFSCDGVLLYSGPIEYISKQLSQTGICRISTSPRFTIVVKEHSSEFH